MFVSMESWQRRETFHIELGIHGESVLIKTDVRRPVLDDGINLLAVVPPDRELFGIIKDYEESFLEDRMDVGGSDPLGFRSQHR